MFDASLPKISSTMAQAIQEAVLLGDSKEIAAVLELAKSDRYFPQSVRYALEAMFYFRRYYGKGGEIEPTGTENKKKALELESVWGRHLIESLDLYVERKADIYAQK